MIKRKGARNKARLAKLEAEVLLLMEKPIGDDFRFAVLEAQVQDLQDMPRGTDSVKVAKLEGSFVRLENYMVEVLKTLGDLSDE